MLNNDTEGRIFQSTLPVRGATALVKSFFCGVRYFNPRSPCGERHREPPDEFHIEAFQSTLPVRGATRDRV